MGGRPLSEIRTRTREALRTLESESSRPIEGEDLARRARVPLELIAHYVRLDCNAGVHHMGGILKNVAQDGREAGDIWDSAIRQNPWPVWVNVSASFRDPVFARCTLTRYQMDLGKFGRKHKVERNRKLRDVQQIASACPALGKVLEASRLALKSNATLPAHNDVNP